jgi:4-aminobutyrate aminotransferase-like enzyme
LIQSHWPSHAGGGAKHESPVEARRCTVQLSTGRLYLDAASTPATALLGHDLPQLPTADVPPDAPPDAPIVQRMVSSLEPGYVCVAIASSYALAAGLAANLARCATGPTACILEWNALDGEPLGSRNLNDLLIAHENETLARTGRWLASAAWLRPPDFIVLGDALALGSPFGAVLARESLAANSAPAQVAGDCFVKSLNTSRKSSTISQNDIVDTGAFSGTSAETATKPTDAAALARVAATIRTVEEEGLLQHGRELADYLAVRLAAVRESCPQIENISGPGLFFRIALAPALSASLIRRRMCERGVLAASDGEGDERRQNDAQTNAEQGTLVINPPLALRIAEADVITGALRGALLDSPMPTASAPCLACASSACATSA